MVVSSKSSVNSGGHGSITCNLANCSNFMYISANDNQPFIEPIQFLEEKPPKIVERQSSSSRRKATARKSRKRKTIKKAKKPIKIEKTIQLKQNIKLEMDYILQTSAEGGGESYERMVSDDPLFTPQVEMKCEEKEEDPNAEEEEEESEKYVDTEDDKEYSMDNEDEDEECEVRHQKVFKKEGEEKHHESEADNDDDDEPLILLTKKTTSRQTYKKTKNPRLKDCLQTCKHKCSSKYNRQQRLDIYHFYWQLSQQDKIDFIRHHVRKPVSKFIRSKNTRNNCCYYLKYYKIDKQPVKKEIEDNATNKTEIETEDTFFDKTQTEDLPFDITKETEDLPFDITKETENISLDEKETKNTPYDMTNTVSFNDEDDELMKVCRVFFHGTLKISEQEIKEAIKDFELKPEKVRPLRDPKVEEEKKLARMLQKQAQQPQLYLDPETGTLTDQKPKRKFKRKKPGDPQPERFPKPINCHIRCKFRCHEKFTEAERKQICDIFWSLDFKRRKDFILSRIETLDVKTPTTPEFRKTDRPVRAYQAKFYLRSGLKSENIRVCKHFLVNTLLINRWFIENAIEFADKTTGAYTGQDRRGIHTSHYKISDDRKQVVLDHINSYPYWIPNKKSKTKYLHHSLTIKKMYEAYKEKCEAQNIEFVTLHYYYKVFHAHFQVLFLASPTPRKGGGFLKSNPNISHFTGEEPGGCWIDSEGIKIDFLRSFNPGVPLDDQQNTRLSASSSNMNSPSPSYAPKPFASGSAAHALNLVNNPLKALISQQQQQSSIPAAYGNLPTDTVNMLRML